MITVFQVTRGGLMIALGLVGVVVGAVASVVLGFGVLVLTVLFTAFGVPLAEAGGLSKRGPV